MSGSNNNQDNAGEGKARRGKYLWSLNFRDIILVALVVNTVYVLPNPFGLTCYSSYFILLFSTSFYVQTIQLLTEAG